MKLLRLWYSKRWKCKLGFHSWDNHQELFVTAHGFGSLDTRHEVVIAWKQCARCADSKLVHILK